MVRTAVGGDGKVTSWRDYLDTNQPISQIQAGMNPDPNHST